MINYRVKYLGDKAQVMTFGRMVKANVFTNVVIDESKLGEDELKREKMYLDKLAKNKEYLVEVAVEPKIVEVTAEVVEPKVVEGKGKGKGL